MTLEITHLYSAFSVQGFPFKSNITKLDGNSSVKRLTKLLKSTYFWKFVTLLLSKNSKLNIVSKKKNCNLIQTCVKILNAIVWEIQEL